MKHDMKIGITFVYHDVFFTVRGAYTHRTPGMEGPGFEDVYITHLDPPLSKHHRENDRFVDGFNEALMEAIHEEIRKLDYSKKVVDKISKREGGIR